MWRLLELEVCECECECECESFSFLSSIQLKSGLRRARDAMSTKNPSSQQNVRPNQSQGVASSGRGLIHRPMRPNYSSVTVANPVGYPPRPVIRPPLYQQQQQQHISNPPITRGLPVSYSHLKLAPSPSPIPDSIGYKHLRDERDETFSILIDRKVRITEGASLYTLCRSWLRNGCPEESQPQQGDVLKSLPRPLPMPTADANVAKEKEGEQDDDDTDEDENVDRFSEDLLRKHIQHAKQVRAQLSNERAKRIERYKTRLSLLLPPLVEQSRNDAPARS